MNTYGDNGNIETIKKRCKWRNISVSTEIVSLGNKLNNDYDFYFFGGGQDKTQEVVSLDLKSKSKAKKIKSPVDTGNIPILLKRIKKKTKKTLLKNRYILTLLSLLANCFTYKNILNIF